MYRIYELTDEAKKQGMNWDEAIYNGEIQTVEEFETKEEALQAYEEEYNDPDLYGGEEEIKQNDKKRVNKYEQCTVNFMFRI